ncbi:MAG: hypothetical protein Q9162_003088 [Coniocarpon cinnabarinum]
MAYKQPRPAFYPAHSSYGDSQAYSMDPPGQRFVQSHDPTLAQSLPSRPAPSGSQRFHPRYWSKRTRIIVGAVIGVILLIIIIAAAVAGSKNNSYPDYTPLTYNIVDTYEPATFFQNFQYFTGYDPTGGFVHYDSMQYATNPTYNTTFVSPDSAFVQVDRTGSNEITGRHSARVTSLKQYNDGLFLFDVKHSPYGCATWPAIWLTDPSNWPLHGEIDIVETVNQGSSGVHSTLHTTNDCSMKVKRKQSGSVDGKNCYNGTDANNGCGVVGATDTYGAALNQNGGGVYACELRKEGIRIWFFARASLPGDVSTAINSGEADTTRPDPSKWGEALADFPSTDCDIGSHFKNQSIIINISLCGQWAGRDYNTVDKCPGNCQDYVAQNPAAFDQAYWELGRFKYVDDEETL